MVSHLILLKKKKTQKNNKTKQILSGFNWLLGNWTKLFMECVNIELHKQWVDNKILKYHLNL